MLTYMWFKATPNKGMNQKSNGLERTLPKTFIGFDIFSDLTLPGFPPLELSYIANKSPFKVI